MRIKTPVVGEIIGSRWNLLVTPVTKVNAMENVESVEN